MDEFLKERGGDNHISIWLIWEQVLLKSNKATIDVADQSSGLQVPRKFP